MVFSGTPDFRPRSCELPNSWSTCTTVTCTEADRYQRHKAGVNVVLKGATRSVECVWWDSTRMGRIDNDGSTSVGESMDEIASRVERFQADY